MSLGDFLAHYKYSSYFINNYILPIGAAIWSTKVSGMLEMPALFFIKFFKNHSLLQIKNRAQWYVIKGGSNQYVEKMIYSFKNKIRLSSPVKKVVRNNEKVEIVFGTSGDSKETFDSVIFANHSNQVLELLDDPSKNEKEILSSIKYQKNDVLLHFDESILPKRKSAWSSWNFHLDSASDKPVAFDCFPFESKNDILLKPTSTSKSHDPGPLIVSPRHTCWYCMVGYIVIFAESFTDGSSKREMKTSRVSTVTVKPYFESSSSLYFPKALSTPAWPAAANA